MNKLKQNSAITLIALVITIIVLLILAAVTLNIVLGENGIFTKARTSKEKMEYASAKEIVDLKVLEVNSEIATNGGEFIEEADVNISNDGQITIEKYLYGSNSLIKSGVVREQSNGTPIAISGIIIFVNEYPQYKFLIGEEGIEGVTTDEITGETTESSFQRVSEFEQTHNFENGTTGGTTGPQTPSPTQGKTASTKNRTLSGSTNINEMTYKNPVIPQGFSAVDEGASWTYTDNTKTEVTGWNDGLVIQDAIGNQFVWVPVDGTDVKYEKWCTAGISYSACSDATDTTTIEGVTYKAIPVADETEQITNYGGFYVARYEAGYASGVNDPSETNHANNIIAVPVSIRGTKVWNYIDYSNAYKSANLMINNSAIYGNIKSGIITGTQWDTIMKWYKNSRIGIGTIDGEKQDWGTYKNKTYTIQSGYYFTYTTDAQNWMSNETAITHSGNSNTTSVYNPDHYHATGLNNDSYKKNIADMAGNVWEWIAETNSKKIVQRGGCAHDNANEYSISYRDCDDSNAFFLVSFRCVLYIQ